MKLKFLNLNQFCPQRTLNFTKEESGAAIVYFALIMYVLIGFVALALDGSFAYIQRQRMQTAADAAALAGVRLMGEGADSTAIETEIAQIAETNGADGVGWSFTDDTLGVRVEVSKTYETFFAGVLGYDTLTVRADAEANLTTVAGLGNLLPMTIKCEDTAFEFGETYTLWDNEPNASGNFGWLNWSGPPSNLQLANDIANPSNSGEWSVGDWVSGGPGVQNSMPVRNALNLWINQVVTIPLYDAVQASGSNTEYHICGFANFKLLDYDFQGSDKWVQGEFMNLLVNGRPGSDDDTNYGVSVARLRR